MALTILHLSHSGLPDPRIERLAVLSKPYGQSLFLGPPGRKDTLFPDSFRAVVHTNAFSTVGNLGFPVFYHLQRRKLAKAVRQINPDIIYAHNIMAAKVALDLSIPFVYDDHEYWSRQALLRRIGDSTLLVRLSNAGRHFLAPRIWRKWETQVLRSSAPTVTVSEAIAAEHRKQGANCTVIPNLPLTQELKHLSPPSLKPGVPRVISLASDFQGFQEHREPGNNLEVWEKEGGVVMDWVGRPPASHLKWIKYRPYIQPNQLLQVLTTDYQLGFVPWAKNWYHRYSFPSKTAWYSHAGLLFILNSDYYSLIGFLPKWSCYIFDDASQLRHILQELRSLSAEEILSTRLRLRDWAKENAVLDGYTHSLEIVLKRAQNTR